jgi:hypothetical protein
MCSLRLFIVNPFLVQFLCSLPCPTFIAEHGGKG